MKARCAERPTSELFVEKRNQLSGDPRAQGDVHELARKDARRADTYTSSSSWKKGREEQRGHTKRKLPTLPCGKRRF